MDQAEENICELEDKNFEIIQRRTKTTKESVNIWSPGRRREEEGSGKLMIKNNNWALLKSEERFGHSSSLS